MNYVRPQTILLQRDFRAKLGSEFEIIGEMINPVGRKKQTVLGDERRQIDLLVGVQVMQLLEAQYAAKNEIAEPCLSEFFTDRGRRVFVGSLLNAQSRFVPNIVPGAPIETLFKSSGRFIRIKRSEPATRGGPGRYRYVTKRTAAYIEVLAAFNTQRHEEQTRAGVATTRLEAWAMAMEAWPGSEYNFEQAFIAEGEARKRRGPPIR